MKAVVAQSYGGSEVLEIKDNLPNPFPLKGQVLIEVYAAGINPFDLKLLSGVYQKNIPLRFPLTTGGDLAGVIKQVGEGVTLFKSGDEVLGTAITLSGGSGSFAQYAVAVVNKLAAKPKSVTFTEAAALPVAGLTAVEAVMDHAKLKRGQKVLIHGGAGGVGHFAIQLAKSLGAHVATTVSADDKEFVKKLGADEAFDYKKEDFSEMVKDYDAVLVTVGGDVADKSYGVLKPGGVLVTTIGQSNEVLEKKYQVKTIKQNTNTDSPQIARLTKLVDEGKLKPHLDKIFFLDQVREAWDRQKSGHPRGKIVLQIKK